MKKLIILLILLFSIHAYGQVELARLSPAMMGGGVTAGPAGFCAGTEIFCDSFDNCTSDAEPDVNCEETWTAGGTNLFLVKADTGDGGVGDKSVLCDPDGTHAALSATYTAQTGNHVVTYKFKLTKNSSSGITLMVGNDEFVGERGAYWMLYESQIYHYGTGSWVKLCDISINTWYTVTLNDINFTSNTYDATVSGGCGSFDNLSFYSGNDLSQWDYVGVDLENNTVTVYLDDVKVTTP